MKYILIAEFTDKAAAEKHARALNRGIAGACVARVEEALEEYREPEPPAVPRTPKEKRFKYTGLDLLRMTQHERKIATVINAHWCEFTVADESGVLIHFATDSNLRGIYERNPYTREWQRVNGLPFKMPRDIHYARRLLRRFAEYELAGAGYWWRHLGNDVEGI